MSRRSCVPTFGETRLPMQGVVSPEFWPPQCMSGLLGERQGPPLSPVQLDPPLWFKQTEYSTRPQRHSLGIVKPLPAAMANKLLVATASASLVESWATWLPVDCGLQLGSLYECHACDKITTMFCSEYVPLTFSMYMHFKGN